MKLRAFLITMLILSVGLLYSTTTIITGYHWNDVQYSGGKPIMSIVFNNLDSTTSSQSDYDAGIIATFDSKPITVGTLFKAPANDSVTIYIIAKTKVLYPGTVNTYYDITYYVDTIALLQGAASYSYTSTNTTTTLSGTGKDYSLLIVPANGIPGTSSNRKNDTLVVTLNPADVNYVPYGWYDWYNR